jgi:glycosyltransferase involved in cell wall biosynthesis
MSDRLLINLSFLFEKPTGISTYANNLIPHLKPLNPTLLSVSNYPEFNCRQIPDNITPTDGLRGHLNRLLWTQFKIPKIYSQLCSSLLFSPIHEAPIYTNCRYILTVYDFIPLRFYRSTHPLSQYFKWYLPHILNQAAHIFCISQITASETIDRFQIPASKITTTLLAHDAERFYFDDREKISSTPYFLYVGRHDPHKNISRIISAFSRIASVSDYELWLVGSEDKRYTPQLRTQVTELSLQQKVKFLEYIPYAELPKIVRQARGLVFPSLWEGFGLPVLEAMACGTPVITSNISSLPEVAGGAAILVDPYQIREISAAMSELIEDDLLHQQLRSLGLQRASQFSWAKTGKATVDVLQYYL